MRLREVWLAAAIALSVMAAPSEARQSSAHRYVASRTSGSDYYTNVNGHQVHRPVQGNQAPAGATARCADGSWSFSENHRGTCSHHGGVARWM